MAHTAASSPTADTAPASTQLEAGTLAYRNANLAMFVGGFATLAMVTARSPCCPCWRTTSA